MPSHTRMYLSGEVPRRTVHRMLNNSQLLQQKKALQTNIESMHFYTGAEASRARTLKCYFILLLFVSLFVLGREEHSFVSDEFSFLREEISIVVTLTVFAVRERHVSFLDLVWHLSYGIDGSKLVMIVVKNHSSCNFINHRA